MEAVRTLYVNGDELTTQADTIAAVAKDAFEATEQVINEFKDFTKHMEERLQEIREKQEFIQDLATDDLVINAQQQQLLAAWMIEQHREGADAVRRYADMLWEEGETKENVEPRQDKGKGRAATIDTEEEDETPVPIPPPSQRSSTGI